MKDIMIDIETLSTATDAAIVSIGAVRFDLTTGEIDSTIYIKVNKQSCVDYGLRVDVDTIEWWFKQSEEAKAQFLSHHDRKPLDEALIDLSEFIDEDDYVWGNGINFDCAILRNAYKVCDVPLPWSTKNERDVRTLVHFKPSIKQEMDFKGVAHHPVADSIHQVRYCSKIYQFLQKC